MRDASHYRTCPRCLKIMLETQDCACEATTDILERAKAIVAAGVLAMERDGERTIKPGIVPDLIAEIERLRGLLQATGDERDTLRQAMQEIVERGPPAEYERIARKALQDE